MWSRRSAASLRFAPEPDRPVRLLLLVQGSAAMLAIAASGLLPVLKLAAWALVLLLLHRALRLMGDRPELRWRPGRGWSLDGRAVELRPGLLDRHLITLSAHPGGRPRSLAVSSSALHPDDHRRLRVALRWYPGRGDGIGEPSGPAVVHRGADGAAGPGRGGPDGPED